MLILPYKQKQVAFVAANVGLIGLLNPKALAMKIVGAIIAEYKKPTDAIAKCTLRW